MRDHAIPHHLRPEGQCSRRTRSGSQGRAVSNPLLEDSSIEGARGIIVSITGGPDLSLAEASEATAFITRVADPEANVIHGIVTNESMRKSVKVTVIATGFRRAARNGDTVPLVANRVNTTARVRPLPSAAAGGPGRVLSDQGAAIGKGRPEGMSGLVRRLRDEWREGRRENP